MTDERPQDFQLNAKGVLAAAIATPLLASIGFLLVAPNMMSALSGMICIGAAAAILGSAVGVISASTRSLARASLIGAGAFGLLVAFPVLLAGSLLAPMAERIWFFITVCALGSIVAQVAAAVGGTANKQSASPRAGQFTLRQLLAFFIPVAIYFGYIGTHVRK